MMDNGVTNLNGKLLSKLIIDSLIYFSKSYNFDKHAMISKGTNNAHT